MQHSSARARILSRFGTTTLSAVDEIELPSQNDAEYLERNRAAWERWAPGQIAAGRRAWAADELRWGIWEVGESTLGLLDGFGHGDDAIELGCGTAAISAWIARRGIRPVGVDIARNQIRAAESLQQDFKVPFTLVHGNAEQVGYDHESFDLAVSEYGASTWCDPRRWLPEAHRLLRPEGRLVFFVNSPILLASTPGDDDPPGDRLVRDHFSSHRVEFTPGSGIEFHLRNGQWIRLLRAAGFVVDDLIEVRPDSTAKPRFGFVSTEWARRWPSEEIWIAHKVA